jgi:hypothetical protein
MNIAELLDRLVEVKQQKAALAAQASELSKLQQTIESDLMNAMMAAGTLRGASEHGHSCSIQKALHPAITDWQQFYDHVVETRSFDLLTKRLSATAFRERWATGTPVPGAQSAEVWEIRVNQSRS